MFPKSRDNINTDHILVDTRKAIVYFLALKRLFNSIL